jgi:hypothetical protein
MKRVFLFLVSALVCGTMMTTSCSKDEDHGVALTGLTVNPTSVKKPVGEIQKVTVTAVPENATDVTYKWTSANESIATVNEEGVVRIQGVGKTTVKVESGTLSATVEVEGTIKSITLKDENGGNSGTYPYNGVSITFTLTATTDPAASVKPEWSTNAENVTVKASENGLSAQVTINGSGAAAVTATVDEVSATYNIATTSVFDDAKGYWTFEDPNNLGKATKGIDLIPEGTINVIEGPSAAKKAVITADNPSGFKWEPHGITETGLTDFTVLIDAWAPVEPDRRYYPIWWNSQAYSCSFYIRSRDSRMTLNRAGGTKGTYTDVITTGQEPWVRLVIQYAADPENAPAGRLLNTYADGKLLDASKDNVSLEMDLYEDLPIWFLTGSPSGATGDYNPYKVSTIAVWDRALTAEEVAALGGVSK